MQEKIDDIPNNILNLKYNSFLENAIHNAAVVINEFNQVIACNKAFLSISGIVEGRLHKIQWTELVSINDDSGASLRTVNGKINIRLLEQKFPDTNNTLIQILPSEVATKDDSLYTENSEKYKLLFDHMISGVVFFEIITDIEGNPTDLYVLEVNKSIEKLSGVPIEYFKGKTLKEIFPSADPNKVELFAKGCLSGKPLEIDLYFTPISKHLRIVAFQTAPSRYAAILADITQKKKTEEALRQSEQLYKLLAENTSDVIWVMDINMNNTYISPSTFRFRGFTVEEHLGQSHEEILSDSSLAFVKKRLKEALDVFNKTRIPNPVSLEVEYKHKDGYTIWAEAIINFIFDNQGNVFGFHGVSRDINDRKKIEEKLEFSERRFSSVLRAIPDAILILSADGKYKDIYTSNPDLLSLPVNELLKSSLHERLDEKSAGEAMSIIRKVIDTNETYQFEYPVTFGTNIRWFQANIAPFETPFGKDVIWVAREITSRKKTEVELKKAKKKAEESDKLKSYFLANMSHEIRTPMNGILGFTSLLKDETITPAERKSFIKMIDNSGELMLKLIDDIIDISKIEAGQMAIEPSMQKLEGLLIDLHSLFEEIKQSKKKGNIKLILSLPEKSGNDQIFTDSMRLTQILSNLLNNALKFTKEGHIEFGYRRKDSLNFEFFVKDTGSGIPKDKHQIIFERFRQVNDNKLNPSGGTGLGLAISKGLVELLGGELKVISEEGKGSTFIFTIRNHTDASQKEQFKDEYTHASHLDWSQFTILIAEDNEISYKLVETILKKKKVNILHAENGKEAIRLVKDHPEINLILMDIHMPIVDGLKATQEIRRLRYSIPIIAQTAYAMKSEKQDCLKSGCNDVITKPIVPQKLVTLIEKYLIGQ